MTIEWKTEQQVFKYNEGSDINEMIEYSPSSANMIILSSTLPTGVTITQYDGYIRIVGTLPKVVETTSYFVTIRLTETENGKVVDLCDRYFELVSESMPVSWHKDVKDNIEVTLFTENNLKLELFNSNGNEVFKKVGGELPDGINLSSDGILFGTVSDNQLVTSESRPAYEFTIDVFVNGEPISPSLARTFKMTIQEASSDTKPYWITEAGILGNISVNESSNFKILAYNMFGDSTLNYELSDSSRLPPGLHLSNPKTDKQQHEPGRIFGTLTSTQTVEYNFDVVATKIENGQKISSDPRTFTIITNDVSKEHQLQWKDNGVLDLGTYYIGNEVVGYVPTPTVEDGSVIKYQLGTGDIPRGLILNENGTFGGVLEYQDVKDYYFTIIVKTNYVSVIKNVIMHVAKGLGKNAIKMYLRINNEYRSEYLDIKSQFNPGTAYKSQNQNFVVDGFPKIDVATLTCYDREVLSHLINYGNPVVLRMKETDSIVHSQINNYGQPIENYEVIFKNIDESTYQWEELNNGSYNFEEKLALENEQLPPNEKPMKMVYNDTFYNNSDMLESDYNEIYGYDKNRDGRSVTYNIFNFKNFRDLLAQPIYVYEKSGEYYYSLGSQELIDPSRITNNYNLYRVVKLDSYGKIIESEYRITSRTQISDDDKIVDYINNCVYDNGLPMLSVIFTPCADNGDGLIQNDTPFVVFDETKSPCYIEKIEDPICFDIEKNSSLVTISTIPNGSEMVLPMITRDDVTFDDNTNGKIQFLDYDVEKIPEWKRVRAKEWQPNTQYLTNEVITYDSVYYECKQQFKSGSEFKYDTNLLTILTKDDVDKLLAKSFFPTLDLGYYEVGTNRYYMAQIHEKEKNGECWYNRDFLFYEIVCEPMFNKDIDTFCVWFKKQENAVINS